MSKDEEKSTFMERLVSLIMRRTVDNLVDSLGHYSKKLVKTAAMILAGIAIAMLGITIVAIGIVKWFALFLPPWLAWVIVGIILLIIGALLVAANK